MTVFRRVGGNPLNPMKTIGGINFIEVMYANLVVKILDTIFIL